MNDVQQTSFTAITHIIYSDRAYVKSKRSKSRHVYIVDSLGN